MKILIYLVSLYIFLSINIKVEAQNIVDSDDEVIKVETQLVPLSLRATDKKGRILPVEKNGLRLMVDGEEQKIDFLEVEPITHYVVLLDASSSMRNKKFDRAVDSLSWLLKATTQDQRLSIYIFAETLHYLGEFRKNEADTLHDRLSATKPEGMTALYDAALEVTHKLQNETESTALIVITDGADSASKATAEVLEAGLFVKNSLTYLIVLNNQMAARQEYTHKDDGEARRAGAEFQKIFQSVLFLPTDTGKLKRVVEEIPREAKDIVRLAFTPSEKAGATGDHRIEIRSPNTRTLLTHRTNYFIATAQQFAVNR